MRAVWLVLAGLWLAAVYLLAAVLCSLAAPTAPYAGPALTMARYALWPFDRTLTGGDATTRSVLASLPWLLAAGWWVVLGHLVIALLLAVTVIGLPLAVTCLSLLPQALDPSGSRVHVGGRAAARGATRPVLALPAGRTLQHP